MKIKNGAEKNDRTLLLLQEKNGLAIGWILVSLYSLQYSKKRPVPERQFRGRLDLWQGCFGAAAVSISLSSGYSIVLCLGFVLRCVVTGKLAGATSKSIFHLSSARANGQEKMKGPMVSSLDRDYYWISVESTAATFFDFECVTKIEVSSHQEANWAGKKPYVSPNHLFERPSHDIRGLKPFWKRSRTVATVKCSGM